MVLSKLLTLWLLASLGIIGSYGTAEYYAKLHNQYVRHQASTDVSDPALLVLAVLKVTETGALASRRAAFECRGTSSLTFLRVITFFAGKWQSVNS